VEKSQGVRLGDLGATQLIHSHYFILKISHREQCTHCTQNGVNLHPAMRPHFLGEDAIIQHSPSLCFAETSRSMIELCLVAFHFSSTITNGWSYTSMPPIYLHGMYRDNFTFTFCHFNNSKILCSLVNFLFIFECTHTHTHTHQLHKNGLKKVLV
jgi:hypothetical protein